MKKWRFLMAGIAIMGFLFILQVNNVFKSYESKRTHQIQNDELAEIDLRPYSRDHRKGRFQVRRQNKKKSQRIARARSKAAAMMKKSGHSTPTEHNFDETLSPEEVAKKKKEDKLNKKSKDKKKKEEEEKKKKEEKEKKKKKEEEEKKKKAEEEKRKLEEEEARRAAEEEANAAEEEPTTPTNVAGPFIGGGGIPPTPPGDLPIGYEEWAALVLRSPDFKNTTKFISSYQTNLIADDTFYQILNEMLVHDNPKMNDLGILAASSTPSYRSFESLTQFMQTKPQNSQHRTKAYGSIRTDYMKITNLRALESVLRFSDSAFSVTLAAQIVSEAAAKHLNKEETKSEEIDESEVGNPTADTHPKAKYFTRFLKVLQKLIQESEDSQATEAANQTLRQLETLLET